MSSHAPSPGPGGEMPPPPPPARKRPRRQAVLDEDTYVQALSRIVERDFFPDNEKLKNQVEWLEALHSQDMSRIREVMARLPTAARHTGTTPGATPLPDQRGEGAEASARGPLVSETGVEVDTSVSVDEFVSRYTSEDNDSFAEIHAQDLADLRRRYWWVWDAERQEAARAAKVLEDGTQQRARLEAGDGTFAASAHRDTRPNRPDGWKFRAENSLLFAPRLEASRDTCRVPQPGEGQAALGNGADRPLLTDGSSPAEQRRRQLGHRRTQERPAPPPKEVHGAHTRFSADQLRRAREVDLGIRDPAQQHGALAESGDGGGGGGAGTGKAYGYVATPSPAPGRSGSPIMTWGEVAATPLLLDSSTPLGDLDGPPNRFRVSETPAREKALHALDAEAQRRRQRRRQRQQGPRTPRLGSGRRGPGSAATPSPTSGSGAGTPLHHRSPALASIARRARPRDDVFGGGLSAGTPRRRTPGTTPTRGRAAETPAGTPKGRTPRVPGLTDDLLPP